MQVLQFMVESIGDQGCGVGVRVRVRVSLLSSELQNST